MATSTAARCPGLCVTSSRCKHQTRTHLLGLRYFLYVPWTLQSLPKLGKLSAREVAIAGGHCALTPLIYAS